jgi:hypothetical protein
MADWLAATPRATLFAYGACALMALYYAARWIRRR